METSGRFVGSSRSPKRTKDAIHFENDRGVSNALRWGDGAQTLLLVIKNCDKFFKGFKEFWAKRE